MTDTLLPRGESYADVYARFRWQIPHAYTLAAHKPAAVALPLPTLFGPYALEYRLRDAGAKVVVTDGENLERVLAVAKGLPALVGVVCVDRADADGVVEYAKAIDGVSDSLEPVATAAEDPALLIYTSGTTGPPKGALHAHRVLLGHLPSIEFYHEYFPKP